MVHQVFDISKKRAFVTGSGSGIGLGIAEGFLEAGATVVLHSRTATALEEAERLRQKGYAVEAVTGDLGDAAEAEAIFQKALDLLDGQMDILVNCAGAQHRAAAVEFPLDQFDQVLSVNLRTVFLLSQLAARNMIPRGDGKIINIASMQSFFGIPGTPAYAASKGGIAQLTKALGNEWISKGINVNALAPGWIRTKMATAVLADQKRMSEIMPRIPAGRWGDPRDFRGPAIFLASAASDYLSGVILPVDGGYSTR